MSAAAQGQIVPAAAAAAASAVSDSTTEATTKGTTKLDPSGTPKKERLGKDKGMLLKIIQGKGNEIKTDTPYDKAMYKSAVRVSNIVDSLLSDVNLIECCEVAVEVAQESGGITFGSPREKHDDQSPIFDKSKVKELSDVSPMFLATVLRKHAKHTITEGAVKLLCKKSHKNFYSTFQYLTGHRRQIILIVPNATHWYWVALGDGHWSLIHTLRSTPEDQDLR